MAIEKLAVGDKLVFTTTPETVATVIGVPPVTTGYALLFGDSTADVDIRKMTHEQYEAAILAGFVYKKTMEGTYCQDIDFAPAETRVLAEWKKLAPPPWSKDA